MAKGISLLKNAQIRKRWWSIFFDAFDFVWSQKNILIYLVDTRRKLIHTFVPNYKGGGQIKCNREEIIS